MGNNNTNPEVDDAKKTEGGENPTAGENKDDAGKGDKAKNPPAKSYSQDDLDAAVKKAVDAAKADWDKQAKLKSLPQDEAEKEKLRQDREQFDKERAELDRRILMQDAKDMLAVEGIPTTFAKNVLGADKKETKENVENFAKEWKEQMTSKIDEQLKNDKPPKDHKNPPTDPFLNGFGL